jgi:enterochelin esterase-like enzyme
MISVGQALRRHSLIWALCVVWLAGACAPALPPEPTPVPTVSLKPANLLTPRPTLPPVTRVPNLDDGDAQVAAAVAGPIPPTEQPKPVLPTATPTPALIGTPVLASEPLQGFLLDETLDSPIIGETFKYRIYLPPDYLSAPQRHYPVLYMLHGAGGNYTEWSDSFLPEQIDRMIMADDIQPMIVVMPDDGESTYWANWDNGPRWGDYVTEDVVGTIDERYRTLPRASDRAIGGLSMGGLGSLNLAFQHPDVFGVVGSHSPSVRLTPDPTLWFLTGENFWEHNPIWLAEHSPGLESVKIWLDVGTDDIWLPNIEAVHTALVNESLQVDWHEYPGPHEAEYWIEHVPDYLRFYSSALAG